MLHSIFFRRATLTVAALLASVLSYGQQVWEPSLTQPSTSYTYRSGETRIGVNAPLPSNPPTGSTTPVKLQVDEGTIVQSESGVVSQPDDCTDPQLQDYRWISLGSDHFKPASLNTYDLYTMRVQQSNYSLYTGLVEDGAYNCGNWTYDGIVGWRDRGS